MILPIVAYGDPILKKRASEISKSTPKLDETILNMYESMYGAHGVGLAAPQVGLSIRLFLVDTSPFADDEEYSVEEQEKLKDFKRTFINAKIIEETGVEWSFNEGCLSIPNVREGPCRTYREVGGWIEPAGYAVTVPDARSLRLSDSRFL